MEKLNAIYKTKYGRDLTEQEAWKMIEFVKMILENADNNLNKLNKQSKVMADQGL